MNENLIKNVFSLEDKTFRIYTKYYARYRYNSIQFSFSPFFKYKIKTLRSRLNSLKLNLVGKFFTERNF